MQKLLAETYKERGKNFLEEVKKWREANPAATYGEALRALYNKEENLWAKIYSARSAANGKNIRGRRAGKIYSRNIGIQACWRRIWPTRFGIWRWRKSRHGGALSASNCLKPCKRPAKLKLKNKICEIQIKLQRNLKVWKFMVKQSRDRNAKQLLKERFATRTWGGRKSKTEEDKELIKDVNLKLKEFVESFGGQRLDIKPQNVIV